MNIIYSILLRLGIMTDIILGMGEVRKTLFELLVDRKFDCIVMDLEDSKCKNYTENKIIENTQYFHVWAGLLF